MKLLVETRVTTNALNSANPWTGKGNPYTLKKGDAIIAAGAGTGISAMFIEQGVADLIIIICNAGRFRMMVHGSTCGLMAYGDAIAMEVGAFEVLHMVEEVPVICGVHATAPRRRMWHWLGKVKQTGFSGVNNFPTHAIADGHFRERVNEGALAFDAHPQCAHVSVGVSSNAPRPGCRRNSGKCSN